ncbi:MAG: hypothetical protein SVY15_09330 [Halobacteriota archaeon]|nr:hypothetical protein [Halobacteriota archaeon]
MIRRNNLKDTCENDRSIRKYGSLTKDLSWLNEAMLEVVAQNE